MNSHVSKVGAVLLQQNQGEEEKSTPLDTHDFMDHNFT